MTSKFTESVLVGMGVMAGAGSLYAADIKSVPVSNVPLINIVSEAPDYGLKYSEKLKFDGSLSKIKVGGSYEISEGWSFDPFDRVLRTDVSENGEFSYSLGDDDFLYQLRKSSPAHEVIDYYKNFRLDKDELIGEAWKVVLGGDPLDFNLSGMTLEEIAGVFKKVNEYGVVDRGDGFWRYSIDLDAGYDVNASSIFENRFSVNDSKVVLKNGYFARGEADIGVDFSAGVNWDKKRLSAGVTVDAGYFFTNEVEKGSFIEAEVSSEVSSFGLGGFERDKTSKFKSESYHAGADIDVFNLRAGAGYWHKKNNDEINRKENAVYLIGGVDRDNFWASGRMGLNCIDEKGFRKSEVNGVRYEVGLGGFRKIDLDSKLFEKIDKSSSDFIYSGAVDFNLVKGVDVYGYLNGYFDEKGVGVVLKGDVLNGMIDNEKNYFASVKLFGKGGDFGDDFRRRILDKADFLEDFVDVSGISWKKKNGVYVFGEKNGDKEEFGGAVCFDKFYVKGGVFKENEKEGYSAEVGGEKIDIYGKYSVSGAGNRESVEVGAEFDLEDCAVFASGSIMDDDKSVFLGIKKTF